MVLVKLKRDTYGVASDYLRMSLEYIYNPDKAKHMNGFGVSTHDAETTQSQFDYVKHYFHRTADNPLVHLIVSFPKEVKTLEKAIELAYYIAFYFKDEYQVIWVIHYKATERSFYHIHLILNPVSFKTGLLYNTSRPNMAYFCDWIESRTHMKTLYFFADLTSSDDI
ncbi:relaxase/mobilization nuclease domain-containing protein [Ruminococcus flavefaciens]|uniref:relaxase/mobilization nuclease domain-containing protein n=1 Tax=Ruminococcus flavefaciens TaxID=1265 RepID=UPI00048F60EB|nr:relaxase/mobilization nuclease domain-containing protein [Ruminococcus flavefaciens]